jgi:hypothetical protein
VPDITGINQKMLPETVLLITEDIDVSAETEIDAG